MLAPPYAGGSAVSMRTSERRLSAAAQCSAVWPWSSITKFNGERCCRRVVSTPKLCSSACSCSRGAAEVLGCSCTNRPVSTSRARRSRSSPRWGGTALSAKRGPPTSTISSAISEGGAALWRGVVLSTLRSWTCDDESVDGATLSAGGRGTP